MKILITMALGSLLIAQASFASSTIADGKYYCEVDFVEIRSDIPKFVNNRIVPLYKGRKLVVVQSDTYYDGDSGREVSMSTIDIVASEEARMTDGSIMRVNQDGSLFVSFEKSVGTMTVSLADCKPI